MRALAAEGFSVGGRQDRAASDDAHLDALDDVVGLAGLDLHGSVFAGADLSGATTTGDALTKLDPSLGRGF